jgi:GNAT superfamily N-acetyltransferase
VNAIRRAQERGQRALQANYAVPRLAGLGFTIVEDQELRSNFDYALDRTHYAGACQRVGRCMRLAITLKGEWVGGIVLGSTFPNIEVRDEALGLKRFVRDYQARGLRSPWCRENKKYWRALQSIVNHARTFVFPDFQGRGIGKNAHRILLSEGVRLWEQRYHHPVYALDTLCDHADSGLFLSNKWSLVGQTKGYTADYSRGFSKIANRASINNASLRPGRVQWQVWVRVIRPEKAPR